MSADAPELSVVGHYSHDTIVSRTGARSQTLGGSVAYIGAVLRALAPRFQVISKVGEDFRYADRVSRDARTAPKVVPGASTTAFVSDFRSGERVGRIEAVCEPFAAAEFTRHHARVGMAGAIAGELGPEALAALIKTSDILIADVQGLIRVADPASGKVTHRPLAETGFAQVAPRISVLKASREESEFLDLAELRQRTQVIVTEGRGGCRILEAEGERRVPAHAEVDETDPTGAGDCFVAGLAVGLALGFPLVEAAKLGNLCGAHAVTEVGVPDFGGDAFRRLCDAHSARKLKLAP